MKTPKDKLYHYFVEKNVNIRREYEYHVNQHMDEHQTNRLSHWGMLLRLNWHYRILRNQSYLYYKPDVPVTTSSKESTPYYREYENSRKSLEELYELLSQYDVISFDIFDTALYRKVEFPNDVFTIMAAEMDHNDFVSVRKTAERQARDLKEKSYGTREIILSEIYDILEKYYGIDRSWQQREVELELDMAEANSYISAVYRKLKEEGKTLVFMSDMYLPKQVILNILNKIGYTGFEKLYLSNEYGLRKGDGKLQKILLEDYPDKKIIHIGDAKASDVDKSIEVGLDAFYNPAANISFRETDMDNLAGSFYRSIINRYLNNGVWDKNIFYEHGFRVGGILAIGFCEYINQIAKAKNIDKIFFCARDCEIIWKVYNKFFKNYENDYIQISRYAILNLTSERYLYDLSNRYIMRYMEQNKSTKPIGMILAESGFQYLIKYLDDNDIDPFLFPAAIDRRKIEDFILSHGDIIKQRNAPSVCAAQKYFGELIGSKSRILVVDIGWSGSCITALKYFLEKHFPNNNLEISGALMCTSRNAALTTSLSAGALNAYIYSPFSNMDLTRFIMPGGPAARSPKKQDLLHMPLEFLFTSTEKSLAEYAESPNGDIIFKRLGKEISNPDEIQDMQTGIMDFAEIFEKSAGKYRRLFCISPYVAFNPLREAIKRSDYCYKVYKNFTYDAFSAPFTKDHATTKFDSLFDHKITESSNEITIDENKIKILFVTPELIYAGAPRSLLRMCKVAINLGYQPIVWSAKPGPFIAEYEKNNIKVQIVPESELKKKETVELIKSYDMAVCNTIVTDQYAEICEKYIPTVWYIREATNIPDFTRNNPRRLKTLANSKCLCCVSDYAANAIKQFTTNDIMVIHNSVEDETDMAVSYVPGSSEKIRFVQFGTMEYRKGYDVLLAAYLAMPEAYRMQSELYFAGGFINSGTPYCSYLFSKMKDIENVHYLGIVQGEENKIRTLSQMDVVVVASRDESCSLVALEGAMLSKPLIVTENVGAKYMVGADNGIITKTDDIESLKSALMKMIDSRSTLQQMGQISRQYYEKYASMESYTNDMKSLYAMAEQKTEWQKHSSSYKSTCQKPNSAIKMSSTEKEPVIVSLTSHPGRIGTVHICIESLLKQKYMPEKVLLWLSKEQFPYQNGDLPEELLLLQKNSIFEIRWVEDDLKPHKKYLYAMQEYPNLPVIIVDDDVIYSESLVEKLMDSYNKFPDCISCMRANLMMFRSNGALRTYGGWLMGYRVLLDIPSYQLLPTGVGGVLYPPHSIPKEAFNISAIKETCLFTDDLWLKIFAVHNGYRTVFPQESCSYEEIPGTNETALWRLNVHKNNNDIAMGNILSYYDQNIGNSKALLEKIRRDRFC